MSAQLERLRSLSPYDSRLRNGNKKEIVFPHQMKTDKNVTHYLNGAPSLRLRRRRVERRHSCDQNSNGAAGVPERARGKEEREEEGEGQRWFHHHDLVGCQSARPGTQAASAATGHN